MERGEVARIVDDLRTGFAGDPDGLRQYALSMVRRLGDAESALWFEFGTVDRRVVPVRWSGDRLNTTALQRWADHRLEWEHADVRRLPAAWLGRFRRTRRVIQDPERTYYPTHFYRAIVAPLRVFDQLRMLVAHRGELIAWIGALRHDGEPEFERRSERRVAATACALADALAGAHVAERAGRTSCDLLLTPTGRVEMASDSGRVLVACPRCRLELREWLREADSGREPATLVCGMRVRWTRMYSPRRVRYSLHLEPVQPARLNAPLSETQRRVAELAARGLTVRQIGGLIAIGEATVRTHLKAVYQRLGVSSRAELATTLVRDGGPAASG